MSEPDGTRKQDLQILNLAVERGILTADQRQTIVDHSDSGLCDHAIRKNLISSADVDLLRPLSEPLTFLPDYEFLEVIGEGATGTVYKARQTRLKRPVALKLLKLSALENQTATARSHVEAEIGARLRHPNIVTVHDYGVQQGRVYLAMEFVEGESLLQMIERNGRLPDHLALMLTKQVVSALAHAADHAIVHRDIKPANLLLTSDIPGLSLPDGIPAVKVSDFGLAFQQQNENATRLTADGATLGTPCYVAPEQLTNADVSHRADIYALGASLYHMTTGVQPFADANAFQALAAKIQGNEDWRNEMPDDVSPGLRQLILDMTTHDVDQRVQNYEVLADRIRDLLKDRNHSTAFVPPDTAPQQDTVEIRPRTAVTKRVATAIAFLTAVITGAVLLSSVGQDSGSPAKVPVQATANQQFLFLGTSVPRGRQQGQWTPDKDGESGDVLAGRNGWLQLAMPEFASRPSDFFQFRAGVNPLHKATGDICFAIRKTGNCYSVRLANGRAELGRLTIGEENFESVDSSTAIAISQQTEPPRYHAVTIEHQPGGWFVSVNGSRLGAVPAAETDENHVTLSATRGTVHFEGIQVVEMTKIPPK